jgi:hypothetical protein
MKLKIIDPNNMLDRSFINWLCIQIRNEVIANINLKKLDNWDRYFNSETVYKSIYKKRISTRDLIVAGVSNLYYQVSEDGFWISINPTKLTPGLDRIKLETICKVINYGNRQIIGYPIFTDTFQKVADNITDYVQKYQTTL